MIYNKDKGWHYEYCNGYPVLNSPIPKKYQNNRGTVMVTQLFGENLVPWYSKGHPAWDLKTKGVLQFTYHNIKGFVMGSRVSKSEEAGSITLQASHSGTVLWSGADPLGGGNCVRLLSDEVLINGMEAKIETLNYHLDSCYVEIGQSVRDRAIIGLAGNTGKYTTGAHDHFGVRPHWKMADGKYEPHYGNGFNGYVNPLQFMADGTIYQKGFMLPRYFQFGKEQHKKDLNFNI